MNEKFSNTELPMFHRINLNVTVQVRPTKFGEALLRSKEARAWEDIHKLYLTKLYEGKKPDPATGYYTFQLWDLMNIFGEVMIIGNPNLPFVNNEIIIVERKGEFELSKLEQEQFDKIHRKFEPI